jgi:DNA-directed RNA polymerase subunit RPC12/RpoP
MQGIIWLFLALIVALVALGAVLAGVRRRRLELDPIPDHCSRCATPMSLRRVPLFKSRAFWGEWECPHCGSRIKAGRGVSETTA